jgi:Fur family ferric uptake transcriptional regulator
MTNEITRILKQHKLRLTACRKQVIEIFLQHPHAIAQTELDVLLNYFDRVTLYRTLHTFIEKGIVHKIIDDSGTTKYAMCSSHCNEHAHHDNHLHFKCITCDSLQCIENISIPNIELPQHFTYIDADILVKGICDKCQ